MPTIDLADDELAALRAAIRRLVDEDRFPHAPRLDPLRSALAKLDAAPKLTPDPPLPKTPPANSRRKAGEALTTGLWPWRGPIRPSDLGGSK